MLSAMSENYHNSCLKVCHYFCDYRIQQSNNIQVQDFVFSVELHLGFTPYPLSIIPYPLSLSLSLIPTPCFLSPNAVPF